MEFGNNIWTGFVVGLVSALVILCAVFESTDRLNEVTEITPMEAEPPDRMMIVEEFEQGSYHFKIWTDTETNVMYLQLGTQGGLTVMLDADGNPLIYKEK